MEGELLATARPYLELFSLLSLTPPPASYGRNRHSWQWKLLMVGFSCYTCCTFLVSCYVCYTNVMILDVEVKVLAVKDFTNALGMAQKIFYILVLGTNSVYMLIFYRRLGEIYKEFSSLELEIGTCFNSFHGPRSRSEFRVYLGKRIALWIIFLAVSFPSITIPLLTDFMSLGDKVLTEFIIIVLQLKTVEYTLFVMLVQELLLRLRQKLIQLQEDSRATDQRTNLNALCQSLRENKHMLARIWRLVGELEAYFMLPILLIIFYYGFCVLHVVNWAFIYALDPNDKYSPCRIAHLLIVLLNIFIPCWITDSCIETYNSFGSILHNIHSGCGLVVPQLLKMILMEYTLQFAHLKLRFSCGGFFDINLKYFTGLVVTIISYTAYLIQFKMQAKLEAKQRF